MFEITYSDFDFAIVVLWYKELETYVCQFILCADKREYENITVCVSEEDYIAIRQHIRTRFLIFVTRGLEVATAEELAFDANAQRYGEMNSCQ